MNKLIQKAQNHLDRNKMTYCGHMKFALGHGLKCVEAGIMLCIHGLLPCFFERSGSNLVRLLKTSFDKHDEEIKHE